MTNSNDIRIDKLGEPISEKERKKNSRALLVFIIFLSAIIFSYHEYRKQKLKERRLVAAAEIVGFVRGGKGGSDFRYGFWAKGERFYGLRRAADLYQFQNDENKITRQFLVAYDSLNPASNRLIVDEVDAKYYNVDLADSTIYFVKKPNYEWMKYDSSLMK